MPSKVAGKMTVWKGTLSLPMNCTLLSLRTHSANNKRQAVHYIPVPSKVAGKMPVWFSGF